MADSQFGGDGSVKWQINVGHVRTGSTHSNGVGRGHHQDGIDETDPGQYFTIYVEVPRDANDKNNLVAGLRAAANGVEGAPAGSGAKVSFNLPIEDNNEDQIRVHWDSKP